MLDLKSDKSIILGLGDLKLSDTEYTLKNEKTINSIHYKPIFFFFSWREEDFNFFDPYERLLVDLVTNEEKAGVLITKNEHHIFYGYGANRLSSNASNIAMGILNSEYSYFINECFNPDTIYREEPELSQRRIIRISNWKSQNANYKLYPTLSIYSNNLKIKKEAFDWWNILEPKIIEFQDAFMEEQLNQLSLRRKK